MTDAHEGSRHRQLLETIDVLVRVPTTQLVQCWLFDEDQRLFDDLWSTGAAPGAA